MGFRTVTYQFDNFVTGFVDLYDDLFFFDLLEYITLPDVYILYDPYSAAVLTLTSPVLGNDDDLEDANGDDEYESEEEFDESHH